MVGYVKYASSIPKPVMNFRKSKARAHDDHPGKMFQLHLHDEKHKKSVDRKHALHSMLRRGNIKHKLLLGQKILRPRKESTTEE